MSNSEPLMPKLVVIKEIIDETPDVKTFRVQFENEDDQKEFLYLPGQFAELSVFGIGEATLCINSTMSRPEFIDFSARRVGEVTTVLHGMSVDDIIGVRGPYGNHFPLDFLAGKNLIFIGGGVGLAPLRGLINHCVDNRDDFAKITLVYGARSPQDLVYKYEVLENWPKARDFECITTVDAGDDTWDGRVGFVPSVLKEVAPSPENAVAITCGPPIMIKFVLEGLRELGFTDENIVTTLEMRMKCGVGQCGRCNIGEKYVCLDGPVFTMAQLKDMPAEY